MGKLNCSVMINFAILLLTVCKGVECYREVEIFAKPNSDVYLPCRFPLTYKYSTVRVSCQRMNHLLSGYSPLQVEHGSKVIHQKYQEKHFRYRNSQSPGQTEQLLCHVKDNNEKIITDISRFKVITYVEFSLPSIFHLRTLKVGKNATFYCVSSYNFTTPVEYLPIFNWTINKIPIVTTNPTVFVKENVLMSSITFEIDSYNNNKEIGCAMYNPPKNPHPIKNSIILNIFDFSADKTSLWRKTTGLTYQVSTKSPVTTTKRPPAFDSEGPGFRWTPTDKKFAILAIVVCSILLLLSLLSCISHCQQGQEASEESLDGTESVTTSDESSDEV